MTSGRVRGSLAAAAVAALLAVIAVLRAPDTPSGAPGAGASSSPGAYASATVPGGSPVDAAASVVLPSPASPAADASSAVPRPARAHSPSTLAPATTPGTPPRAGESAGRTSEAGARPRSATDPALVFAYWRLYGPDPAAYRLDADTSVAWQGSRSARVTARPEARAELSFGGVLQSADAVPYRGKRVRFTVQVRTLAAQGATIGLGGHDRNGVQVTNKFMLVTPSRRVPLAGTTGWTTLQLVTDVPAEAVTLDYGAFLLGTGTLWVDSAELAVVDSAVAVTQPPPLDDTRFVRDARTAPPVLPTPTDLDFEIAAPGADSPYPRRAPDG